MNYKTVSIILLILVATLLIGIFLVYIMNGITGQAVLEDEIYYTKAICNDVNYCQDYVIYCRGGEFVRMVPVDGAEVWHERDWVDPRGEDLAGELC